MTKPRMLLALALCSVVVVVQGASTCTLTFQSGSCIECPEGTNCQTCVFIPPSPSSPSPPHAALVSARPPLSALPHGHPSDPRVAHVAPASPCLLLLIVFVFRRASHRSPISLAIRGCGAPALPRGRGGVDTTPTASARSSCRAAGGARRPTSKRASCARARAATLAAREAAGTRRARRSARRATSTRSAPRASMAQVFCRVCVCRRAQATPRALSSRAATPRARVARRW